MSSQSRREYLAAIHRRYGNVSRKEKSIILKEFCTNCGYHPKHAIRLLSNFNHFTKPKHKKKGRKSLYNKDIVLKPLKYIWPGANLPYSKRRKAILPLWLPGYLHKYGDLDIEVIEQLLTICHATIDRILKPVRVKFKGSGRSTTNVQYPNRPVFCYNIRLNNQLRFNN